MTNNKERPAVLSDLALERIIRDVFSGIWSPRPREPTQPTTAGVTRAGLEATADDELSRQSLQPLPAKPGN